MRCWSAYSSTSAPSSGHRSTLSRWSRSRGTRWRCGSRRCAEINQLLAKGDADVAFLSSGAYMVYGKKEDVRLLAMPERNGANYYFSYVIVPRASSVTSLMELRGRLHQPSRLLCSLDLLPLPDHGREEKSSIKDLLNSHIKIPSRSVCSECGGTLCVWILFPLHVS